MTAPALHPDRPLAESLRAAIARVLDEARATLARADGAEAAAIHDFRKSMKRWRALLRLLEPCIGASATELRGTARDLARRLATARDAQSALEALDDLGEALPPRTRSAVAARLEQARRSTEAIVLDDAGRETLAAGLAMAERGVKEWPLDTVTFAALARSLAATYRRARSAIPADWHKASADELHEFRKRVIAHRYQMELVEPIWPRLGKLWVAEAQRLRDRLGTYQDLHVLAELTAPGEILARWHDRLAAPITARQRKHLRAADRLAARLFAEKQKAFRRRLESLWEAGLGD